MRVPLVVVLALILFALWLTEAKAGSGGHSPQAVQFCAAHLTQIQRMGVEAAREDFERWLAKQTEAPDQSYVEMVRQMLDQYDVNDPSSSAVTCLTFMRGQKI